MLLKMIIIYQQKILETYAKEKNLWNEKDKLNFTKTFQDPSSYRNDRLKNGRTLLEQLTKNCNFSALDMMSILRDEQSGICMSDSTAGSQVSVLKRNLSKKANQLYECHFFTATPNPQTSLFKPFIFSDKVELGPLTVSHPNALDTNRVHPLYVVHRNATREQLEDIRLRNFERDAIIEIITRLKSSNDEKKVKI